MKKYDNFCLALNNLKDIYNYDEPYDNVTLTGLVALFEICFEQAWKAIKESLEIHGLQTAGSPRMIIKIAYKANMINDEQIWLKCLASRNNAAHAYNQLIALEIVNDTKKMYCDMFSKLQQEIKNNWL